MSIAPGDVILEEEDTEEDRAEKKSKFLEKRKTYDFHEYPAHPQPLNIEAADTADIEEEGEGNKQNEEVEEDEQD